MKTSGLLVYIIRGTVAIIAGFVLTMMAVKYVPELHAHPAQEVMLLILAPAMALAFLIFQVEPKILLHFKGAGTPTRIAVPSLTLLTAGILVAIEKPTSVSGAVITFLGGSALSFIVLSSVIPYLNAMITQGDLFILLIANAFGNAASLSLAIFLPPFQGRPIVLGLTVVLFSLGSGIIFYHLFCDWKKRIQEKSRGIAYEILIVLLLFIFALAISVIVFHFREIATTKDVTFGNSLGLISLTSFVLTLPGLAWLYYFPRQAVWWNDLRNTRLAAFVWKYRIELITAGFFFLIYFALSNVFDIQLFHRDDMFFDADAAAWQTRLATSMWADPYQRSLHPLALMVLRPAVMALGYFLMGNNVLAVSILTALAGAVCVFLISYLVRTKTQNPLYGLLAAAIFGLSTTQLMFGALVETYIFSALLLIIFILTIQNEKTPLAYLITLSIMTMGITLTNLFQNLAAVFVFRPNLKLLFRYTALVLSSVIVLSLINNVIYPNAGPLFFIPSTMDTEKTNFHSVSVPRIRVAVRELFFYSEVAPTPIIISGLTRYPRFWFHAQTIVKRNIFKEALSGFESPIGKAGSYIWGGLILISMIYFLRELIRKGDSSRLLLTLALILLFNLSLHTIYGYELFLYSPHVFYALALFIFLSLAELTRHRWYLPALCAFLGIVMVNNFLFLYTVIHTLLMSVIQA